MTGLLLALFSSTALAIPMGNPGRTTQSGMFELHAEIGQSFQPLDLKDDPSCTEYCTAMSWLRGYSGRLNFRPTDFLGLWGEVGRTADILDGTDHAAVGIGYAGGVHLAMPGIQPRPALSARVQWLSTTAIGEEGEIASEDRALTAEAAALLVLGDANGGVNAWVGPIGTLISARDTAVYYADTATALDYSPRRPVGAIIGGEMVSNPLGEYIRGRSLRVVFGMEARAIDAWAATGWFGFAY